MAIGPNHRCARWRVIVAVLASASVVLAFTSQARGSPPNDHFADASVLSEFPAELDGTNVDATAEPGEPMTLEAGGRTVWWRWTAPTSASVAVRACSSAIRPTFRVYTGDSVNALRRVGGTESFYFTGRGPSAVIPRSCETGPVVSFFSTEGQTYYIAVDGVLGDQGGFRLELSAGADVDVELVQTAGQPLARFVYRALPGQRNALSLDVGMLVRGDGEPAFPGVSFFGGWPGAAGRACDSDAFFCVIPEGARATGPRIDLGDRDDGARIELARPGAVLLAGAGDDSIQASGRVMGGPGDDAINGYALGRAMISGGPGQDTLLGSNKDDVIDGGPGTDFLADRSLDENRSARRGHDILRTRDGEVDTLSCGLGDTAFIDAYDEYPNCSHVFRRGRPRAVPTWAYRGDDKLEVTVSCPRDGPRVCSGRLSIAKGQRVLKRTAFKVRRHGDCSSSAVLAVSVAGLERWQTGETKLRLAVRSRDRRGRPTIASGRFTLQLSPMFMSALRCDRP
jgi:RTX calcium-binding nonapeptide repeat (4 copies)